MSSITGYEFLINIKRILTVLALYNPLARGTVQGHGHVLSLRSVSPNFRSTALGDPGVFSKTSPNMSCRLNSIMFYSSMQSIFKMYTDFDGINNMKIHSLTGMWTYHCSPGGPSQGASPLTPVSVVLKPLRLRGKQRLCPSCPSGGQTSALRTFTWGDLSLTFPF